MATPLAARAPAPVSPQASGPMEMKSPGSDRRKDCRKDLAPAAHSQVTSKPAADRREENS